MLSIGIVGLPNVGKSTLFNTLTKKGVPAENYPFTTINPSVGVVAVPDERLEKLAAFSKSAKVVPAAIEFVDIAGLVKGAAEGQGLGNQFLAHIREVDAICHIVRCFIDDSIIHVDGRVDPARDIETIKTELELADLEMTERHKKKMAGKNKEEQELPLLSKKPVIYVFNIKKGGKNIIPEAPGLSVEVDVAAGEGVDELIRAGYDLLRLITFFTTGPDETRAWTIRRGSTAPEAGSAIHSDFKDKFIKVSVINWQILLDAGSEAKAREKGLIKTAGRDYLVADGDVIEFKI